MKQTSWLATYNRRLATSEQVQAEIRNFLEAIQTFQDRCVDRNAAFKTVCARYDALFLAPASTPGSSAAHLARQRAATTDHNLDVERYGAAVDALQAELVALECDLGILEHRKSSETAAAIQHLRAQAAAIRAPDVRDGEWKSRFMGRRLAVNSARGYIERLNEMVKTCADSISNQRSICASLDGMQVDAQLRIRADAIAMRHGVCPSAEFLERPNQEGLARLREQGEAASDEWTSARRNFSQSRIGLQELLLRVQVQQKDALQGIIGGAKKAHGSSLEMLDGNLCELKERIVDIKSAEVIEAMELWIELVVVPGLDPSSSASTPEST
ncbi:hypothetical protein PpBr36_04334 [Pyricularia pennisetigena]|uniref:hypothetical protein n=1 Tax=Pyricularia pennisetigena TaxID=1578925 RepID=UPI001152C561|nr:hypothetical protein PpBr36_04334 [Pyricularia pennisetigena]TLS26443.1 hypothetical protein PpBr36_04334 [Pyricularia pennisetigena]